MAKKILIIEDDADILEILQIILEEEDFEVSAHRNGLTAEQISGIYPDLVILDIRIVGYEKKGDQICAELKSFPSTQHLPIMLVSAEKNLSTMAKECGADAYISKPFEVSGLIKEVKELIY